MTTRLVARLIDALDRGFGDAAFVAVDVRLDDAKLRVQDVIEYLSDAQSMQG